MKLMAFSAALCAGLLLAGCANEPVVAAGPTMPPPTSVAEADQRLAAVTREQAAIEARFVERERVCYQKFFVTRCLDDAKERHRTALAAQHAIEVDAERFKRQVRVDERDRAMAEADAKYREDEARLAAQPPAPRAVTEAPPPRPSPVTERVAQHEAKIKQEQQKEAADAAKRAANVRAYEERKKESDERQRRVRERLEEKRAKEAKAKGEKAEALQQAPQQQPAPNGQ